MAKKKNPQDPTSGISPITESNGGLKVREEKKRLGKTVFNFYPNQLGGEIEAYNECSLKAAGSRVFWDDKLQCFYYYLPD